ncbi:unnamed protein product [Schistosoma margrebowiei]|uniref:Uncharacterized protein n=1 Tax=Schistosoma margrebowiei TaxID=48269 RepID=A0A183MSY6_9TREM|nr:unnamed protein product [Schistosoma margrebowiei]
MVVEGSRQETLDPGFVLLGTRQQGVPVPIIQGFLSTTSNHHLISSRFRLQDTEAHMHDWFGIRLKRRTFSFRPYFRKQQ